MKIDKIIIILLATTLQAASAASVDTSAFRQRHILDKAAASENERLVAGDMKRQTIKNGDTAIYVIPALSSVKRMPDAYPEDGRLFASVDWVAAKDEFEPASFLFYPFRDLDDVQISVSDLKGKNGTIKAAQIDLKVVKLWYQGGSAWHGFFADPLGRTLVPELLLHDENLVRTDDKTGDYYLRYENDDGDRRWAWLSSRFEVTDYSFDNQANQHLIKDAESLCPFVLNKGEFKQIIATLHIPQSQPDGLYKGTMTVKSGSRTIATLQTRCRVLPFTLPDPKTFYNPEKGYYLSMYGTKSQNEKVLRNLAEHNCKTPMGFPNIDTMNPEGLKDDIALAKKCGISLRPIFSGVDGCGIAVYSKEVSNVDKAKLDKLRTTLRKVRELALEHLGHSDFYSYAIDEGGPHTIRAERQAWSAVHEAGGKVMVSSHAHRELLHNLDYMVLPGLPVPAREKEVHLFHQSNPDALCGWYANPHSGPENPDYFRRIHGILPWKAGYDVAANYCWWRNNWNDFAVPYEPSLRAIIAIYGARDSVIDTLAWEGVREGLDDCRYASYLQSLCLKAMKNTDAAVASKGRRALAFLAYWDAYRESPDAFRAECVSHIMALEASMKGAK